MGALLVMWKPIRQQTLGLVVVFGAGVLISAVAYELVAEAIETAGDAEGRLWAVGAGLAAGALTFFLGDWYIDRMGGEKRKRSRQEAGDSALPLTLGIVLDGIPESIVLRLTLLTGNGVSASRSLWNHACLRRVVVLTTPRPGVTKLTRRHRQRD